MAVNPQKMENAEKADTIGFSLTAMERAWVRQALTTQRAALMRSRQKEIAGSEIWSLRGKEIDSLNVLIERF